LISGWKASARLILPFKDLFRLLQENLYDFTSLRVVVEDALFEE